MPEIGPYQLKEKIHRGKFAEIFTAVDSRTGQEVGLKLLAAESLNDPTIRARYQREAQIIATLNHPAIVPVLEFGEHVNQPYIVMPWMAGGSLEQRLAGGPLSLEEAIAILEQIAPALDAVHELDILHGDIKPSNILFDTEGRAYLSDFGMVKLAEASLSPGASVLLGPPAYFSPEQAYGSEELDGRSDVYMLGILWFEMLAGQLPYLAETPLGYAIQHMTIPLPSLAALRPELPAACDAILARAVDRLPSHRFASAGDFLHGLQSLDHPPRRQSQVLVTASLPLRPKPVFQEEVLDIHVKAKRKLTLSSSRGRVWLIIGLISLVIAFFSGLYFLGQQGIGPLAGFSEPLPSAVSEAVNTPLPAVTLPLLPPRLIHTATASPTNLPTQEAAVEILPSSTPTVSLPTPTHTPNYEPLIIQATQAYTTTYSVQSADTFFSVASRFRADLESLLTANRKTCRDRPSVGVDVVIPGSPETAVSVPVYPLTVNNFNLAVEQIRLPCMQNINSLAFSPDGQMLALASGNMVFGWRVGDWKPIFQLIGHTNAVRDLAFSPDGATIATASDDTSVRLWSTSDGQPLATKFNHVAQVTSIVFAPDGQGYYSGSLDSNLQSWSSQGEPIKQVRLEPIYSLGIAQTPAGETLLAVGLANRVDVLSASDLATLFTLPVSGRPGHLEFTPDGLLLASESDVWHIPEQRQIYQLDGAPGSVSFSSDGQLLAVGGQIWRILNGSLLAAIPEAATKPPRDNFLEQGAFSPLSNFFAWANKTSIAIWGLPKDYALDPSSGLVTHIVKDKETLLNVANLYQVKLEPLLSLNGLTCLSPIFSGQHLLIPDQPEDQLVLDRTAHPAITTENVADLKKLSTLDATCNFTLFDLSFAENGQFLISGSALWDNFTGAMRIQASSVPLDLGGKPEEDLSSPLLVLSPDQQTLAIRVEDRIELWDVSSATLLRTLTGNKGFISSIAFSPDGQTLASSTLVTKKFKGEVNEIRIWDLQKGERKWVKPRYALHMQFTADGQKLISLSENAIQIWRAEDGELLTSRTGIESQPVISLDGAYLAFIACKDNEKINGQCLTDVVQIIRTDTGQVSLAGLGGLSADIQSLTFSRDNTSLAGASGNGIIIWSVTNGSVLHSLKVTDSRAYIQDIIFAPNSNLLVSTDQGDRLLFWSLIDNQLLATIPNLPVDDLVFSADGRLLSILSEHEISLWGLDSP
jgi:serine/threonine protein kinase/dipeptidyl aminopeptidase/acylaminoacyl peptidase